MRGFCIGAIVTAFACLAAVLADDVIVPKYTASECIAAYQYAGQEGSK